MGKVFGILLLTLAACACAKPEPTVKIDPLEQAREDAKTLMSSMVPVAEKVLLRDGSLTALGFAIKGDGQIVEVVTPPEEQAAAEDPAEPVRAILLDQAQSGVFRATALATERRIKLPKTGIESNAMAIAIDHKADYSVVLVFPYVLSDGKLEWSAPFTEPGAKQMFTQ